jgi:hypothetical protein
MNLYYLTFSLVGVLLASGCYTARTVVKVPVLELKVLSFEAPRWKPEREPCDSLRIDVEIRNQHSRPMSIVYASLMNKLGNMDLFDMQNQTWRISRIKMGMMISYDFSAVVTLARYSSKREIVELLLTDKPFELVNESLIKEPQSYLGLTNLIYRICGIVECKDRSGEALIRGQGKAIINYRKQ